MLSLLVCKREVRIKYSKPPCLLCTQINSYSIASIPNSVLKYYLVLIRITSRELSNAPNEHYTNHVATKPCTTQYIAQQPTAHNQTPQ